MRTLLLLCLVLTGASAWCRHGQPCPSTPVSAQGEGGPGVLHHWVTPPCIPLCPGPAHQQCGAVPGWLILPQHKQLPAGVPCANGHRCCPQGSRCSADGESCITPPGKGAPRAVPCPDGESECPDDATCCVTASGAWGCCPMPQASCCADKVHCCPHATVCDLAHGRCLSPTGDTPMGTTFPAWKRRPPVSVHQVLCPDGRSACPDGATCCQMSPVQYGCCPLQNVSDSPATGTLCHTPHTVSPSCPRPRCVPVRPRGSGTDPALPCRPCAAAMGSTAALRAPPVTWSAPHARPRGAGNPSGHPCPKVSAPPHALPLPGEGTRALSVPLSPARDVKCDQETSCPDGNTCCRLSSGAWGCCPLEEAVCCPDHIHCCPQGYTCDPSAGSCLQQGGGRRPWLRKTPALWRGGDVQCDQEKSCPQGSTCCRLSTGAWGCCPLEQAVCCRDHQHCCPWGYTCNVATQSCEKLLTPTLLLGAPTSPPRAPTPRPAPLRAAGTDPAAAVPCDAARSCRGGHRCCRTRGGSWGCCPFSQGSCCSDGRHCCPVGSRCTGGGWGCSPQRWDLPAPRRVLL
uniref:Uncharacterized protein n=1 Tax=Melopsittacus undulatus TaxID=13146 RepID=A0A8V5H3N0_MELUD